MLVPIPGSDGSYEYDPSIPAPSGGGGGGGGDFSYVDVTFINSGGENTKYNVFAIDVDETKGLAETGYDVETTLTVSILTYKGNAFIPIPWFTNINNTVMPSCTGDITLDLGDDFGFFIRGEGTITFAGAQMGGGIS